MKEQLVSEKPIVFKSLDKEIGYAYSSKYVHGDHLAVYVLSEIGEPIATVSTNLTPELMNMLNPDEIYFKSYGEGEIIRDDIINSGIFEPTGRYAQQAFGHFEVLKVNFDVKEEMESTNGKQLEISNS